MGILDRFRLDDKTALVTGAGQGIGRAFAHALAEASASVAIVDINPETAKKVADEIRELGPRSLALVADVTVADDVKKVVDKIIQMGGDACMMQADIRDSSEVDEMVKTIINSYGKIDILVNNAGVNEDGVIWKMCDHAWHKVFDTNLTGAFHCTRAVIPFMREQRHGRIINITSVVGQVGVVGTSGYSAAIRASSW